MTCPAEPTTPSPGSGEGFRSREIYGIGLYVLSVFCFCSMDVVGKLLLERHEPLMVVWARYASQGFWAVVIMAPWLRTMLRTSQPGLQVVRALMPFGTSLSFFYAIQHMQLAEAVAVFEVCPLIITVLAYFVLGEKVGPRRWAGVGIGLAGALIIIRPGTDVFQTASLLPILGAFCFAGYAILTRLMGPRESHWTSFLYTALIGAALASLLVPFYWSTPSLADAAVMSVFGVLGGIGHILMTLALRHTPASVAAPFNYTGLVWAAMWGLVVFGEFPDVWTWVGAAVIIGAGLYVWWRERQRAREIA